MVDLVQQVAGLGARVEGSAGDRPTERRRGPLGELGLAGTRLAAQQQRPLGSERRVDRFEIAPLEDVDALLVDTSIGERLAATLAIERDVGAGHWVESGGRESSVLVFRPAAIVRKSSFKR